MKKILFPFFLSFIFFQLHVFCHGVGIVDVSTGSFLHLSKSEIDVTINNQVAIVKSTQVFKNNLGEVASFKFGFPMHADASSISLRWKINGTWFDAGIQEEPQDPSIPGSGGGGSGSLTNLNQYLGNTPLYFQPEDSIGVDSTVIFEITYVELLPYSFGKVAFHYPNDYSLIQNDIIEEGAGFNYVLNSDRTIIDVDFISHTGTIINNGNQALVSFSSNILEPVTDVEIEYELASDELGVLDMSTLLPDSLVTCDEYGSGFVTLVIEPEANEDVQVIEKNFTLIIDRSGSMGGNKIIQARDAAKYITQNLNAGDYFNIVDFSSSVTSFSPTHVPYNASNELAALDYIDDIVSGGGTNISGSLSTSIQQFSVADPDKANIIIFFTDGEATSGTTSTQGILAIVENSVQTAETEIYLFTFGIGSNVNEQLLTLLAVENNGLVEFLGNDELQSSITDFFLTINNPVLLNTTVSINPPIIEEFYPNPLPNLYMGQQLIVAGRYYNALPVTITLTGNAFSVPVQYEYDVVLADSIVPEYSFLPKLWAKKKIDALTLEYYALNSGDPQTDILQTEIEDVSLCYSVLSVFTSYTQPTTPDPGGGTDPNGGGSTVSVIEFDVGDNLKEIPVTVEVLPNPFRDVLRLKLVASDDLNQIAEIMITDIQGKLIKRFSVDINAAGEYILEWDASSYDLPSGHYLCTIQIGNNIKGIKLLKE